MTEEREANLYVVQLLDQTDRYSDMVDLMKRVIEADPVLTSDQRNLLSVSYKNVITSRRNGLRYLTSLADREEAKVTAQREEQINAFRKEIIDELDHFCLELIKLVDDALLPAAQDPEARLYYYKLKADYWRYISENKLGEEKETTAKQARDAYEAALEIARTEIPPYKPTSLGLVLNYSVYLYEIVGEKEAAIDLASKTGEECALTIANNSKEPWTEAMNILQLFRDSIALWSQPNE
jgi:14-3-3 protein epsilon